QHWERRPGDPPGVAPSVIVGALRRGAAIMFGARSAQYADPRHARHVVVVDKLNGDTDAVAHLMLHGVDPLIPASGGGCERSLARSQNYMTINYIVYRA